MNQENWTTATVDYVFGKAYRLTSDEENVDLLHVYGEAIDDEEPADFRKSPEGLDDISPLEKGEEVEVCYRNANQHESIDVVTKIREPTQDELIDPVLFADPFVEPEPFDVEEYPEIKNRAVTLFEDLESLYPNVTEQLNDVVLDAEKLAEEIEADLEEQDDETTEADEDTTMSYDFISTDDEEQNDEEQFNTVGSMWTLGNHSGLSDQNTSGLKSAIETTLDSIDREVDGDVAEVLEDASSLIEDTSVHQFECPHIDCGLSHSHADYKHDIRSSFNVTEGFASQMELVPYCHCGVNELSMLMSFYSSIGTSVFEDDDQFEGINEVDSEVLEAMYRFYVDDDCSVSVAAGRAASRRGLDESEAIPLGVREDIKRFFERRRAIEGAANSAPIPQKTRALIEERREELQEMTSNL